MSTFTAVVANPDGTLPASLQATQTGQYAKVGVHNNRLAVEATIVETPLENETASTFTHGSATVTTPGTAVPLAGAVTKFQTVLVVPLRTNAGATYIGSISTSGGQQVQLPWAVSAPSGEYIDLSKIYLDAIVAGNGAAWEGIL